MPQDGRRWMKVYEKDRRPHRVMPSPYPYGLGQNTALDARGCRLPCGEKPAYCFYECHRRTQRGACLRQFCPGPLRWRIFRKRARVCRSLVVLRSSRQSQSEVRQIQEQTQQKPLPVYVRQDANEWEYKGRFRVAHVATDESNRATLTTDMPRPVVASTTLPAGAHGAENWRKLLVRIERIRQSTPLLIRSHLSRNCSVS
jgi:hypothetical protein